MTHSEWTAACDDSRSVKYVSELGTEILFKAWEAQSELGYP